jgi:hypothetical protein
MGRRIKPDTVADDWLAWASSATSWLSLFFLITSSYTCILLFTIVVYTQNAVYDYL